MNESLIAKLRCPACSGAFSCRENSLLCENGHCFEVKFTVEGGVLTVQRIEEA